MHQIRLNRAWSCHRLADGDKPTRLCYERRFHSPSGLSPDQTVELTLERKLANLPDFTVRLNGQLLVQADGETNISTAAAPFLCPIQQLLQPFNTLHVEFTVPAISEKKPSDSVIDDFVRSAEHEQSPPSFESLFDARLLILGD
jgi:hypothetical protein